MLLHIINNAASLVIFRNRSWITDQASYNFRTGKIINFTDTPVSDAYIHSIQNKVSNHFTVSSRILDFDYWSLLFE